MKPTCFDVLRWLQEEWDATQAWVDSLEERLYIVRWDNDRVHSFDVREVPVRVRKWLQTRDT